jgi:release factor glutamine methyltransferase
LPEVVLVGRSIADALRDATAILRASSSTPRLDAELLLAFVLGVDRTRLVVEARRELDPAAVARFEALVARRLAHEPVAYILGRRDFRRITLSVDRRVLIPRPETELLVEVGLTLEHGARVVDVGTGSGAVALALKDERPDLEVWATDVDPEALSVARDNGFHLGLEVEFVQADLLAGVSERFDAVLANLPYVAAGAPLPPDVAQYEPTGALFGGEDGLEVIRRLVTELPDVGLIALEVGFDQARVVADLLGQRAARVAPRAARLAPRAARLAPRVARAGRPTNSIEILHDLGGHERVVVARR